MSNITSNGEPDISSSPLRGSHTTAAADVSFAKLNPEHHAESNSLAESSKSSEKRKSNTSEKLMRYKDKGLNAIGTPASAGKRNTYHEGSSRLPRKTGGFLLDSVFVNGKPNGGSPAPQRNGKSASPKEHAQKNKRASQLSDDSSQRSSPLSLEVSLGDDAKPKTERRAGTRSPSMDPAQLVQMALNLSESRKRHVSSSLPLPISPAGSRRVASGLDSGYGTVRSTSSSAKRYSQINGTRNDPSPSSNRTSQRVSEDIDMPDAENVLYTFSPATLSRAERARKYFELASEHRRLLQHLPPLKSDVTAPGNYTMQATSSPGSAHYSMDRVPSKNQTQHRLGRSYNPLQALRNRRLRTRERRPLTAPPDTWQETDRIKHWIDGVEAASKDSFYRPGEDQVRLPPFPGELDAEAARPDTAHRHRRSDTASSVITRPENGWSIEPAELLADTYWTERSDNKTIIEDRSGKRIFPSRARASLEVPRQSKESGRMVDYSSDKHSQHNESDTDDRVRHRRRNMLPIPGRLRRNHATRSGSTSSASSDDGRKPPALRFGNAEGGDENIGPLERHMREMIAKDERGELSSPELVSPDHWDSRYTQFPNARSQIDRDTRPTSTQNRLSVDTTGHRRSRSADGRMGSVDHGMASMDEFMSDSPASPVESRLAASTTAKAEDVPSKHKSKRSHIPILRNRSKERNNTDSTDFATRLGKPLSPVMSAESSSFQPRSSLDSARPVTFKRHRTTESTSSSIYRTYTAGTATDSSAKDSIGRRFLKGGRIGELVRNEGSRIGDRFRSSRDKIGDPSMASDASRQQSDASDTEDTNRRRRGEPGDTDSQVSPRGSFEQERQNTRYFTQNLPSFKSPSGRNKRSTVETPMSEQSDPFSRYQRSADNQGSRSGLVPTINLPEDDTVSNPDLARNLPSFDISGDRRKSASQNNLSLVPTNTTLSRPKRQDGLPVTGLSGHDARRHWSISDQAQPVQVNKVTMRDIARVRALLLASGIKAHEIRVRADAPRDTPLPLLSKITEITGNNFDQIALKEENVFAARALSDDLSNSLSDFERLLNHFRNQTAKDLNTRLNDLSHRASEQLTNIVYETSDEADAFNVELTTKQPQEVKRVDDAVDAMFRQRRRQFRMVRRAGFKLLEWLVLGIMWWVWFVVVCFNCVKKGFLGLVRLVRWLVWF